MPGSFSDIKALSGNKGEVEKALYHIILIAHLISFQLGQTPKHSALANLCVQQS